MSRNKAVIEAYLASTDRTKIAPLLTDDVEWIEWGEGVPPEGVRTSGKAAFVANFGDDELRCEISRMTEENDVVVAEGTVRVFKKDGRTIRVQFCDIFEMMHGKIKRLNSYAALIKEPA